MKFPALTRCAALALLLALPLFAGCDKIRKIVGKKDAPAAGAAASPAPGSADGKNAANPDPAKNGEPSAPVAAPEPAPSANKDASVMVLCYHRFEDKAGGAYSVSAAEFERELQAVKDAGFTVISMQDFLAWRRDEKAIPAKSALITIDDGYLSAYTTGWPILKKFGYPFTMFVYVQYVNSGGKSVTWEQLGEMRDEGVEIGSHSYTHQDLRGKGKLVNKQAAADIQKMGYEAWLEREVADSKRVIERQLGIKVSTIAYPYGASNPQVLEAVKKAGYEAGFTVYGQRVGFNNAPETIGRYAVEIAKPTIFHNAIGMIGGGQPGTVSMGSVAALDAPGANVADLQVAPANGAKINNPRPLFKAVLTPWGPLDPASVELRVSGFGRVNAQYDEATQTVTFQPVTQALHDQEYTVILSAKEAGKTGKKHEARWGFTFIPTTAP